MRVAILDDDQQVLDSVSLAMGQAGFTCKTYRLSREFLLDLKRESFDLLLVDWLLPDVAGIEVIKTIRSQMHNEMPILLVTARDAERDVIEALEAGADDFMVKSTRSGELVARAKALLRRTRKKPEVERVFELGPFKLDTRTHDAWRDGAHIELTQKEFNLALILLKNVGKPLSRGHIREIVWGRGTEVPSRTMDTHISRVRTKLDLRPESGFLLAPVYSYGYRLEQLGNEDEQAA
jgi:two-component system, OmpR family, response regulator RegX3